MDNSRMTRLRAWNDSVNDLPRKALVIACVLLCLFGFAKIFIYVAPFVVALVLSTLLEPLLRVLCREGSRVRLPRKLATLLCMLVVLGLLVLVIILLSTRALSELKQLASTLPQRAARLVADINVWVDQTFVWLDDRLDIVSDEAMSTVRDAALQIGRTLMTSATSFANTIARYAITTAISVPQIVLFITLSVLGTYYMASDRERIVAYFRRLLPQNSRTLLTTLKSGMFRALFGQLRAQLFLTLIMFCELLIGFSVMGIRYGVLLAIFIALLDALPVIGSGLFLIPWSLFGFVTGDMYTGVGMMILYGATIVIRQVVEPKVVGAQLGVYPLVAMVSMYFGFALFGVMGMLLGPVTFLLCRVTVYAVCGGAPEEIVRVAAKPQKPGRRQKKQ